jgi:predicted ferric reductase
MTAVADRPRTGPRGTAVPPPQPPQAGAHPTAVLSVILAGAVASIALWWANTPSINGLGDWLTNAGRITGLLAGYAVVVLVALMARIPALERGIGADKLARWHSMGGRYTVSLVVAHGLLIIWGYAVTAHTSVISQTGTLLTSYPDVLMATMGGLLLVGVGIASARAARRRMHYETWYFLHFYTYLAVALAFSHQFATGAEFINNRPARTLWLAMYLTVAAAVFWYRLLIPIRQALRHRMRVAAVYPEAPGVVSIVVRGTHLDELGAEPGQFFRWRFLAATCGGPRTRTRCQRRRAATNCASRSRSSASTAPASLHPGRRVFAEGPYGAMTAGRRRRRKVLLIAGGIGITPLRALFESLPGEPGDIQLLYRVSRGTHVVFREELEAIAHDRGAQLHFVTGSRAQLGYDPLSAHALMMSIPDLREHEIYLCGPAPMAHSAIAALRSARVPRRQIHHESFEF